MTDSTRRARASLLLAFPIACAVACGGSSGDAPTTPPPGAPPGENPPGPTTGPDGRKVGVVLLADTNRSGAIELDAADEEAGRDTWDAKHGAVFLPNLDDDEGRCPKSGKDEVLAACFDGADTVVNGADDALDLAPLRTRPWAEVPAGVTAKLSVTEAAKDKVRLFKKRGADYEALDLDTAELSTDELRAGVELALEGTDVVRDASVWDGFVDVTVTARRGDEVVDSDKVRLRLSPVMTPSHLDAPEQIYTAYVDDEFNADVAAASTAAGLPKVQELQTQDVWAQDYFEPAFVSMPGPGGAPRVMHLNYRSANYSRGALRAAGRAVFTLRGKDVGAVVAYDPKHSDSMDTLNSFGNFETIPPFEHGGKSFPLGRVLRGKTASFYPDPAFVTMVESQKVQEPLYVDTSWLIVGHVDEFFSFIPASTPRGWALLVADPVGAKVILDGLTTKGQGAATVFKGKKVWGDRTEVTAEKTVEQILADAEVLSTSQQAAAKIDAALSVLRAATGLADDEIVRVPFLFEPGYGRSVAYQPGMVNGISLGKRFASPRPHGPVVEGKDVFEKAFEDLLAPRGITVHWVEDWDTYHRNLGEVHCGSNTRRTPKNAAFWSLGR